MWAIKFTLIYFFLLKSAKCNKDQPSIFINYLFMKKHMRKLKSSVLFIYEKTYEKIKIISE